MVRALLASGSSALVLACAAAAFPAGSRGASGDAGRTGPSSSSCAENDIETFDPRYAGDAYSFRATRLIHAGLVRLDPDTLEPRPYLAKSWRWLDPLTLHVELRDGRPHPFHSGRAASRPR